MVEGRKEEKAYRVVESFLAGPGTFTESVTGCLNKGTDWIALLLVP